jgi:3-methyladenine DNA glycosylase Mpg
VSIPTITPVPKPAKLPTDLLGDTLVHEGLADELNKLLAETEAQEGRRPMAINAFGQWCTRDALGGWQPHPTYMAAYHTAHAGEVA